MSREPAPSADPAPAGATQGGAANAGAMLRQAREAAGVHIAALAVSLKVPATRLEALEQGRIDQLPDLVFARALAASVCRALKIDPESVLRQMPRTGAAPLVSDDAHVKAPFKPQPQRPASSRFAHFPRPLALAVLALLAGTLVLIFVPNLGFDKSAPDDAAGNAVAVPEALQGGRPGEVVESAALNLKSQAVPATIRPAAPPAPVASAAAAPAPSAAAAPAVAVGPLAAAPAATAAESAPAATDIVVFRTSTEAWIQVTDAKGAALVRKTVPGGETIGVSGALPLRVTVGRADATKVSVRGEPLDLAPLTKGSVARFEVK